MARFRRRGGGVQADLERWEVGLIRELRDAIREAIEVPDVEDPALHRLFPTVVPDDELEDAAARMQFHDSLLESKLAGLDALGEILDRARPHRDRLRVTLADDEPPLFLGVLNDLRLALAARIGMEHVERRDVDADDDRAQGLAIIDHLAWLQEQLVRLLDPLASSHQEDPDFLDRVDDHHEGSAG